MTNEPESHGSGSKGRKSERVDRTRMKTGYGRASVERSDEPGIRSGNPENTSGQPDVEADEGRPSRQTSTAAENSGQV